MRLTVPVLGILALSAGGVMAAAPDTRNAAEPGGANASA